MTLPDARDSVPAKASIQGTWANSQSDLELVQRKQPTGGTLHVLALSHERVARLQDGKPRPSFWMLRRWRSGSRNRCYPGREPVLTWPVRRVGMAQEGYRGRRRRLLPTQRHRPFAVSPADLAADAGVALQTAPSQGLTLAYNTRNRDEVDTVLSQAEALGGDASRAPHGKRSGAAIMATLPIPMASCGRSHGTRALPSRPMAV